MADVQEIDAVTGLDTFRDFTPEELAEREAAAAAYLAAMEQAQAQADSEAAARESAVTKLAALGFEIEEISALLRRSV